MMGLFFMVLQVKDVLVRGHPRLGAIRIVISTRGTLRTIQTTRDLSVIGIHSQSLSLLGVIAAVVIYFLRRVITQQPHRPPSSIILKTHQIIQLNLHRAVYPYPSSRPLIWYDRYDESMCTMFRVLSVFWIST